MSTIHILAASGDEVATLHDRKDICLLTAVRLFKQCKATYWYWS